jgi:hypothetical protein
MAAARRHQDRIESFVGSHRFLRERGFRHPVYDFLFTYYSFSRGQLLRWSPGTGILLEAKCRDEIPWDAYFSQKNNYWHIDPVSFPEHRLPYLAWAIRYLQGIQNRSPAFHCFGLHEWAMLYHAKAKHHSEVPLRVTGKVLSELIESTQLCCTHYDAYRFFTPEAYPKNRWTLSRDAVMEFDQPGCIHVTMDLYKFGYKIAPFISSDLLADLFFIAVRAREVDMRASPYDLSGFGFQPIRIETREGREQYVQLQRNLHREAGSLREQLLQSYRTLLRNNGGSLEVIGSVLKESRITTETEDNPQD